MSNIEIDEKEVGPDLELKIWITPFRFLGTLTMSSDLKAEIEFELKEPLIIKEPTLDNLYKGFFDMMLIAGSKAAGGKDA